MSSVRGALSRLGAAEIASGVRAGSLRAIDVLEDALARIDALDGGLAAFSKVWREPARARAQELDRQRGEGADPGPLAGVPVALKSNLCVQGEEVHCGSRMLEGWRAPYHATAVERLLAAGAVLVGATNMDEFGMGSSGEHSAFGVSRNPWDLERTPGGSSSGSAAAVAAGLVPLALGSDTGGSVRQPAALCGVCGFKPSYGRVSRFGLVAYASSLDVVSTLAREVRDLELATAVLSGVDARDPTTLPLPALEPAPTAPGPERLDGWRVGVPREFLPPALEGDVRARVEDGLRILESLGAQLVPLRLPGAAQVLSIYYVLASAEASSNLARFDGLRYGHFHSGDGSLAGGVTASRSAGFGDEVKRRILLGTYVLSAGYQDAWYRTAQTARARLIADFEAAFAEVDVLAGPTSPVPAFPLGERSGDPLAMYLCDVLTVPASLAGLPAVSVPCGTVERAGHTLPVGLQLAGARGEDARVLRAARAFEAAAARAPRSPLFLQELEA